MSQNSPRTPRQRFAASNPESRSAASMPATKPEMPSTTATPSRRSITSVPAHTAESRNQPSSEELSFNELAAAGTFRSGSCQGMTSEAPSLREVMRRVSLPPLANRSPFAPVPVRGSFVERTSASTVPTSEGGEETFTLAVSCVTPSGALPPTSAEAQMEGAEDKSLDHAVSIVPEAAARGVYRSRRSVTSGTFTSEKGARFQRSLTRADVRVHTDVYCNAMEHGPEGSIALRDAVGARGTEQPPDERSSVLDEGEASFVPCADVCVAVVPTSSSCAIHPAEREETEAATSSTEGEVEMTLSGVNQEVQATGKDDLEGEGKKKVQAPSPAGTLSSYLAAFLNELTKHPILDSGRRRVSISTLQGQLCLTYCTCSALVFVFILQSVMDHTTFHGRCISPILYPSYRLPLEDRMPVPVLFGYGACQYNLGQSDLYRLQSNSTGVIPAGDKWPPDNVDVRLVPPFRQMNGWEMSMMGGLDANKIRNYNEYFRLFTGIFMHGNWVHLVSNLVFILILLWLIEPVWGFLRTAFTFFISGLTASLCASVLNPCTISVGASGALYGLVGALIPLTIEFWDYLEYPVWLLSLVLSNIVVSQALNCFVFANVDNWAHTAGFFAGLIFGFATVTSLHSWRWEGIHERLASLEASSWMFSPEERERLQAANHTRVQRYRRRRRTGRLYWPRAVWKWKGHQREWTVRLVCAATLMAVWITTVLYLVVPSFYSTETFGPLSIPRRGKCICCRLKVSPEAPSDARLPVQANKGVFWCFLGSLPRRAQCA